MKQKTVDPEEGLARLVQEATNQSTPEKALDERPKQPLIRRKTALPRTKAPKV